MNLSIFASEYRKTNTSKRSLLNGSAAVVGLSAGALGWSGLALASGDEARLQTVMLPDHYSLQEDGVVVVSLTTGEQMILSDDQYVILDGGLLLIVDELAQNAMTQLPVMGALRTELFMEFQPVRSPDGSIVEASNARPLWTGEEAAPRLFEQVDIQRFELAQNGSEAEIQSGTNIGQITSAAAGGLSLAGLRLASGIIGAEPEAAAEKEEPTAPAAPSEYLSNAMFQALTPTNARAFTGTAGDSFIGYTAANSTAQDALIDAGKGAGNSATFDMSAGGDNTFVAGSTAASGSGSIVYTGGSGNDSLTFGDELAFRSGAATFDMSAGGDNTFVAGAFAAADGGGLDYKGGSGNDSLTFDDHLAPDGGIATFDMSAGGTNSFVAGVNVANDSGSFAYTGGSGDDSLTFGDDLAYEDGTATFDMSRGGNNTFVAGSSAASSSGSLAYTGGSGDDSLTFGPNLVLEGGTGTFDMSLGGNNTFVVGDRAASSSGSIAYTGGSGDDSLTFGSDLASAGTATFDMSLGGNNTFVAGISAASSSGSIVYTGGSGDDSLTFGGDLAYGGSATLDLGDDTAADIVTFLGTIGDNGGTVTIKNFNFNHDTIDVPVLNPAATVGITAINGGKDLTYVESNGSYTSTIIFDEIGPSGTGVIASSAQLLADII